MSLFVARIFLVVNTLELYGKLKIITFNLHNIIPFKILDNSLQSSLCVRFFTWTSLILRFHKVVPSNVSVCRDFQSASPNEDSLVYLFREFPRGFGTNILLFDRWLK